MSVEQRVVKLERQVSWLRAALGLFLFGGLALLFTGATESAGDVLVAKGVKIVDETGLTGIEIGAPHDFPSISVKEKGGGYFQILFLNGAPFIRLQGRSFGPEMFITPQSISFRVWEEEYFKDEQGITKSVPLPRLLVQLGSTLSESSWQSYVTLNGLDEKPRIQLTTQEKGGRFVVYNKTNEPVASMFPDEYGNGVVGAWNRNGKGRTLTPGPSD